MEVYEVLSESYREMKMYREAIEAYLTVAMIKKRTITNQISKNLLIHMDKQLAIDILAQLIKEASAQSVLYYVQVGKLLMWLQDTYYI